MYKAYKRFYTNTYLRTSGFIPALPPGSHLYPGDYFQVRNGAIIKLGNIYKDGVIGGEAIKISHNNKLNPFSWDFHEGVSVQFLGADSVSRDDIASYSKHILSFSGSGAHIFKGNEPFATRIANWADIEPELIIKMTQTLFSFRDLYVVTEAVAFTDWSLAVAAGDGAELELISETPAMGRRHVFSDILSNMVLSKDLECFIRSDAKVPSFFKARKLVVQETRQDYIISALIARQTNYGEWANGFFDGQYDTTNEPTDYRSSHSSISTLDLLQANQLNPNTALQYFRWADANLDDIEKLFISYDS